MLEIRRDGDIYHVDDEKLAGGDSTRITDHDELWVTAGQPSELILIDAPLRWRPVGVWAR